MLKSPGLKLFTRQIAGVRRPSILDLGPPRGQNVTYFSQWPGVLHIEDLLRTLAEDPEMSAPEEERDVKGAIERAITQPGRHPLRCAPRLESVRLYRRLDDPDDHAPDRAPLPFRHDSVHDVLDQETIPDDPGRFTIVDEQHLSFESMGGGGRNGSKHTPLSLERMMPGFRLQHSFLLAGGMQDYLLQS